jgi:hypothetical protein
MHQSGTMRTLALRSIAAETLVLNAEPTHGIENQTKPGQQR